MAKSLDHLAYQLFEDEMKDRMKPSLIKLKEEEGYEAYFDAIRNTIAGCRAKWKIFPKEVKQEFAKRVADKPPVVTQQSPQLPKKSSNNTSEDFSPTRQTYFDFRRTRFEELKKSGLSFAERSRVVSLDWEKIKGAKPKVKKSAKTGYNLFRKEHSEEFRNQLGLKGNALTSKLGEAWRKLSDKSRKAHTMKAFVLDQVKDRKPTKIVRSKSVTFDSERKIVSPKKFSSVKDKDNKQVCSKSVLVSTAVTVADSDLDIPELTNVVNIPDDNDEYVLRSGSVGNNGESTSFFDTETDPYVAGTPVPDCYGEVGENSGGERDAGGAVAGGGCDDQDWSVETDAHFDGTSVPDWHGEAGANCVGGRDAGEAVAVGGGDDQDWGLENDADFDGTPVPDWHGEGWANSYGERDEGGAVAGGGCDDQDWG